jgi:hypothetical protein
MTLEILILARERHKNVTGLNWLVGSQPLDNWISNGNTNIMINKLKKTTYYHKNE